MRHQEPVAVTFTGGTVVDGSGRPGYVADVTVDRTRIVAITPPGTGTAHTRDITGLVLAPGFIDMHAHSELALLTGRHEAKVTQGVTTEVLGQDGLSYAPADERVLAQLRHQLAGWNGEDGLPARPWRTVADYLAVLDRGVPVNAAYLVPHGTIRMLVVGLDDQPATGVELKAMGRIVAEAMVDGAVGMSTGLTYTPGMYADTGELIELCRVVAAAGGYYCPHHRSYGRDALAAYAEQIEVARRAGVALHLAHAVLNYPVNRGRAGELLDLIDGAVDSGIDVTFDTYPYLAGASYLHAVLPSWAQAGGHAATLRRLGDPAIRWRLADALERIGTDGNHGLPVDWSVVRVAGVARGSNVAAVGRTVAELASSAGTTPVEVFFQLLSDDELGTTALFEVGDADNVERLMRHPRHTGGSDGIVIGTRPHPRAWGTFPRFLGHYVRERRALSIEVAVAHMTGTAARRLGLTDRGRVDVGCAADLVCFEPDTIADMATYQMPRQRCRGVRHVLVNGEFVVEDGELTGRRPGRALRRCRPSAPAGQTRGTDMPAPTPRRRP